MDHLVDLDAAFGRGSNRELIASIVGRLDLQVELSGGIRDTDSLEAALATGCRRVNIGTAALEDPDWTASVIAAHGDRVAIGLDVRGTTLAARGWTREGGDLWETLARLDAEGCARYVVTDVNKDGMLQGPNVELLRDVCARTDRPVVASGGVSTLEDIATIRELVGEGVEGAIVGSALYRGAFTLPEALDVAGRPGHDRTPPAQRRHDAHGRPCRLRRSGMGGQVDPVARVLRRHGRGRRRARRGAWRGARACRATTRRWPSWSVRRGALARARGRRGGRGRRLRGARRRHAQRHGRRHPDVPRRVAGAAMFTSLESLAAWDPGARPVPVRAAAAAQAAISEECHVLLVDVASPHATVLRPSMLWALAQERAWEPSHRDAHVAAAVRAAVEAEAQVSGHRWRPASRPGRACCGSCCRSSPASTPTSSGPSRHGSGSGSRPTARPVRGSML